MFYTKVMDKKRIVIVGGGFGGVRAALDLSRHVYQDAEIILVDKDTYHEYHPNYYRIATTFLPESKLRRPETFYELRDEVSIPLSEIIHKNKVRIAEEEVTAIDPKLQTISFLSGNSLSYDWLILAVGSVSNFFDIEGAKEYSLELKSAHDALGIRNAIDELFSSTPKHRMINIVIAGGGLSGSELAASLACFVKRLTRIHSHPAGLIQITIVETADSILRDIRSEVRKKAEKRLKDLGVRIFVRSRITKVTRQEVEGIEIIAAEDHILRKKNSNESSEPFSLPYSIFIWTAGVKAHPLADYIGGAKRNQKSCLMVDEHLRVLPFENIFAIGDVAACISSADTFLPMTAQVAISQGRYVAYTLRRIIHKKMIFRYYERRSHFVIPLGTRYALFDLGWVVLSGRLGWWLKRLITLDYLTGIVSFQSALWRWRESHRER